MLKREVMQNKLCDVLRTEYVALLGQRDSGMEDFVNSIINDGPPIRVMHCITVDLPLGQLNENDFLELLISRLIAAASSIPPISVVARELDEALDKNLKKGPLFRLNKIFEVMGSRTSAEYLVIVLNAISHIESKPLKSLLLMLRDYHNQRKHVGALGAKLRFLVTGDASLWHLCCDKSNDRSPFNIAERIFLEGLSPAEIQALDSGPGPEAALKLHVLTDGIPLFIEKALHWNSGDITPFFGLLQNYWNRLDDYTRDALRRLVDGEELFPSCEPDFACTHVPRLTDAWEDAFWCGFLKAENGRLAWRTPIHQAFVERQGRKKKSPTCTEANKTDLHGLSKRLETALGGESPARELEHSLAGGILGIKYARDEYDVFLCHNSKDKPAVKEIGVKLLDYGIHPWLDEWDCRPGSVWLDVLEDIIKKVKNAAVFVGPHGVGPWEKKEIQSLLKRFVEGGVHVIPVMLSGADNEPNWSLFLDSFHRVDFRKTEPDPLHQLVWGVTGKKPDNRPL